MDRIVKFFDRYTSDNIGFEVIPVLPRSKIPFWKGWNDADYDRERVRRYLASHPDCNIGIRLGKIMDVEADDPKANRLLESLLPDDYPHPTYKSQKSVHHLFTAPDPESPRVVAHGIEFRGYKNQSLLPPSVNANGVEYKWLTWASPIPDLPEALLNLYNKHRKIMVGARSGVLLEPVCAKCGKKSRPIHHKRHRLEVMAFRSLGQRWQCHKCRVDDVRTICRKMKYAGLSKR